MPTARNSQKPWIPESNLAAAITLSALLLLAYHNSFHGPFVLDDGPAILENSSIRNLWQLGDVLMPDLEGGVTTKGRPILNFSFAVDYALNGYAVFGYHVVNLLIHFIAGLTLFGIIRRTFQQKITSTRYGADAFGLALVASALWTLHPLQTAAVTYIVQRGESLTGLFYLTTLYAFIRARGSKHPRLWFAGSILSCLAGMGTKEVMVSAPIMVLLYDRTFIAGTLSKALRQNWRYYTVLASTWLLLAALILGVSGRGSTAGFETTVTPWHYLLTQCWAVIHYLRLVFLPVPLVFDYGFGIVDGLSVVWWQASVMLILAGGTAIALWKQPILGFVGFWFLAILAPSSSFVPIASQTIAEHRMYLPLIAPVLLLVCVLHYYTILWAKPILWLLAVTCTSLTIARNGDYISELSIWQDTVAKRPDNARAHLNYGRAKLQRGQITEAITAFKAATKIAPRFYEPHYNRGLALSQLGHQLEAIEQFQTALRIKPDLAEAYLNIANIMFEMERLSEAGRYYESAISLKPNLAATRSSYGNYLIHEGRPRDALKQCEIAIQLDPNLTDAYLNAAAACIMINNLPAAVSHYLTVLKKNTNLQEARNNLANVYLELGQFSEAIEQYQAALDTDPNMIEARRNLALLLLHLDRPFAARPHLVILAKILPNDPDIREALLRTDIRN
jgi:protein O-mannosyl-transferase